MKCCIKILTVVFGLLISSNLVAADITTMKRFGAEDVSNHISAKVLEANKLVLSTGYYSVIKPDTFILDGSSSNITYNRVDNLGVHIGYGLFDLIELDVGVNFSYELLDQSEKEDLISKTDEKAGGSFSSNAPNSFDFAGATGMLKLKLLDTSIFKFNLAGLFESKARDTAIYTVSRSSKFLGGWAILTDLTPTEFLSVAVNVGSLYASEEEQLCDYKVSDRVLVQTLVTLSPSEYLDLFGGLEFKNIKMDSRFQMGNNAYGGLKIKGSDLSLVVFAGSKLDDGGVGYGKLYLGSSLSYAINFSDSNSDMVKTKEVKTKEQTASNKNSKRLDSKQAINNKEKLSLTQKDGIFYDYDGNPIDTKNNFKELNDDTHDEFYDFDRRIEASAKNDELDPAVLSEKYYAEELERAKIEKVKREKAELEQYKQSEIARKKALKKRVDEEDRLDESYSRNEIKELKDLPEIYDDEINWNGLK